ncbi:MAG TPA: nucleotide sugar dehydrogenase [Candidatus Udaeobacter sp.]|nr:nucleotide sugar dehydrogenase [Candidatus Udaeobacter sp.]
MIQDIAVIGLGKLGGSMAGCLASRGFNVIGVDVSQKAVDALNAGRAPAQETGLDELIGNNRKRVRATMSHEEAILSTDLSFVIVPTPSDTRGAFSLQYAAYAFEAIGKALAKRDRYHTVVLTSTVLPGSTRYGLLPILEEFSGKKCGKDFGLCYSPEFIALGTVIRDYLNPDFFLIGEFDERSGTAVESVNSRVAINNASSKRMSIENAELAKISLNSYVTLKISYANMLADICERIPGGDVDVVSDAIGMDKRIGRRYLTGGFGYGGPCFPRDNLALDFLGQQLSASTHLLQVNDEYNRTISPRFVDKLEPYLHDRSTVAVLGLAYKPQSHVIEESPGIYLCRTLAGRGLRVLGYDPLATQQARVALQYHALVVDSLATCLQDAECVLVTTPDDAFKALKPQDFIGKKQFVTIVDFWRCLPESVRTHPAIRYVPVGRCIDDEAASEKLQSLWRADKN